MAARALDVAAAMGLRSTMWEARTETADAAPPAPEAASLIQAPPEDVGRVIAEEQASVVRRATRFDDADVTTTTEPASGGSDDHGAVPWLLVALVLAAGAAGIVVLSRAERARPDRVGET
jgi:hypothetical protein